MQPPGPRRSRTGSKYSSGIHLDGGSYQVPSLLRKKRSQEPRMKGGFNILAMKSLSVSPGEPLSVEEQRSASDFESKEDANSKESAYLRGKVSVRARKWMTHLRLG